MKNIQHPTSNTQHSVALRRDGQWLFDVGCWLLDVPKSALIFTIRAYRLTISPAQSFLFGAGGGCRFTPTCSQFAMEAVREHGALTGSVLAVKRICRCQPWGGCGHDPVPKKEFAVRNSECGI
jgi:putative membrane protein insertion efficiency factor